MDAAGEETDRVVGRDVGQVFSQSLRWATFSTTTASGGSFR